MTWVVAACISLVIVKVCLVFIGAGWVGRRVKPILLNLRTFQETGDEDHRQHLLMVSGWLTLQFSLTVMGFLALVAAIAFAGPWFWAWNMAEKTDYWLAMTFFGIVWWLLDVWRSRGWSRGGACK